MAWGVILCNPIVIIITIIPISDSKDCWVELSDWGEIRLFSTNQNTCFDVIIDCDREKRWFRTTLNMFSVPMEHDKSRSFNSKAYSDCHSDTRLSSRSLCAQWYGMTWYVVSANWSHCPHMVQPTINLLKANFGWRIICTILIFVGPHVRQIW